MLSKVEREFLVRAVNNQGERINKEGRALILDLCSRYGVAFKPTLCQTCWHDAAFLVLQADRRDNNHPQKRKIVVREGVDIYFNGKRVNDILVTTDAECRRLLKEGLTPDYFCFIEDEAEQGHKI